MPCGPLSAPWQAKARGPCEHTGCHPSAEMVKTEHGLYDLQEALAEVANQHFASADVFRAVAR